MKATCYKNITTTADIEDQSGRTIVAYVSKFDMIDYDGDMMAKGCYRNSLNQRSKELFHLSNHRPQPEFVLGKDVKFEEDSIGLKMISTIRETNHGNDVLQGYKDGIFNQHSVMFAMMKGKSEIRKTSDGKDYNYITEAKLYEGSTVIWGANPDTPLVGIKSYFEDVYQNNIAVAFDKVNALSKALRKGTYSDEFFPLLEIELKLLRSFIEEQTAKKSTETAPAFQPQPEQKFNIIDFAKDISHTIKSTQK